MRADDIRKKLAGFTAFLTSAGAEVLTTTNEWELARFRTAEVTSVIYFNKRGEVSFTGESLTAWKAFRDNQAWKPALATENGKRAPRVKKASPVIRTVRERDGDLCFFCRLEVREAEASLEHLVPLGHGGPSHMSNFFLAHKVCNSKAGHLSAVEKIAIHVRAELKNAEKWWKRDNKVGTYFLRSRGDSTFPRDY